MKYEDDMIRGDGDLLDLLERANPKDVHVLVDFLTDNGKGRVALSADVRIALDNAKNENHYSRDELMLLIRELQLFGGNSLVNLVRRKGVSYAEIVQDVLEHVGGKPNGDNLALMETQILEKLVTKRWAAMSERERADFARQYCTNTDFGKLELDAVLASFRANAGNAARLGAAAAAAVGSLLTEGALTAGASTLLGRAATVALGPIGAGIGSVAGVYAMSKEAYRVTLPCVVQIAYIRQKDQQRGC